MIRIIKTLAFAACLSLSACGGSSSSSGSNGGDIPTGGVDNPSLSHQGTPLPVNVVDPVSASYFSEIGRTRAAELPQDLGVIYEVVDNHGPDAGENCKTQGAQWNSCSVANLHIKDAAGSLNEGNWKLYFHSIRRILRVDSDEFSVSRVNGDLNYLEPASGFKGFDGEVKTIKLVTEFSHLIESDFMPRYWLVHDGGAPQIIANTDEETDENRYSVAITGDNRHAFNGETIPLASAASRFQKNAQLSADSATLTERQIQARIVPMPAQVEMGVGILDISNGFSFAGTDLSSGSLAALSARQTQFMSAGSGAPLTMNLEAGLPVNSYELVVSDTGITINGADEQALFYGAQSLLALVQPGKGTIPVMTVTDEPRFGFRGFHVDSARNFHSLDTMKRLLDQMAAYKLNKLHLHLSDDEGWRLEIPSLPELTSVGARRQFQLDSNGDVSEAAGLMPQLGSGPAANNQGSGHYSQAEFVELLAYAKDRFIDVIPEFDMPAHARAAVVAMRARAARLGTPDDINIRLDDPADTSRYLTIQHYDDGLLNPCLPGTYRFVETIISDVQAMYAQAGATLKTWHMGGDEARNVFKGGGFQDVNDADKVSYQGDVDASAWDYPWEKSPACTAFIDDTAGVASRDDLQPYFVKQVAQRVADAGIATFFAYQDIYDDLPADQLPTQNAGVGFWETISTGGFNSINEFSNRGYQTVVAVPDFLYFDFPQEVDPEERGYYWATRYTDTAKVFGFAPENLPQNAETSVNREGNAWSASGDAANQGFAGMQGQLWSETVRTAEQFDYMVFPRLLALAERAWHRADWELDYAPGQTYSGSTNLVDKTALANDFAGFAATLGNKELLKLDAAFVLYRIPVPGASAAAGSLDMSIALPGLPLEYSSDGSSFQPFAVGDSAAGVTHIRARSADGSRAGRADSLD
ncbi:MAG: family 20 glycosylhydrolase [Granulosicoccus sp.]